MLSRPYLNRIPDQSMILGTQEDSIDYVIATRDSEGSYAMVYFPTGKTIQLDLSKLSGNSLQGWWYDPRTGNAFDAKEIGKSKNVKINPPTSGKGHDWVLVLDQTSKKFMPPGSTY